MIFTYVIIFIFGSIIGSFLNVCIFRLPEDESIIKPPSHCPGCHKPIKYYDNIPLISYIILKGHCRYCKKFISFQYFIVELLTALLFTYLFQRFGLSLNFVVSAVFFSSLIVISFIDMKYQIIPDIVSVGALIFVLLANLFMSVKGPYDLMQLPLVISLQGAIFGAGLIYLTAIIFNFLIFDVIGGIYKKLNKEFYLFKKFESEEKATCIGLGDVTLMALIGSFLGWQAVLITFILAPLIGSIIGIFILFFKKDHLIAYGPFLSLACLIAFIWQQNIIKLLSNFFFL